MSTPRRMGVMVIDLQYGSTGKGLLAGYLAEKHSPDTLITAWGANSGHTYIDSEGRKFVHTMLANGIVSKNLERILLGPGSLINPASLMAEIKAASDVIDRDVEIWIHPHAAIITQKHIDEEAGPMTKIGSTKKGVGAAMIDRIRRNPDDNNVAINLLSEGYEDAFGIGMYVSPSIAHFNEQLEKARVFQVEGAQGYSLSMYHGLYPYTTSRDVTPAQMFADCAIPMHWYGDTTIIGTARTFPIRVANRFDDQGKQVGYSGGCYLDQREMQWSELGIRAELTTVTKLPRRIFTFSPTQLAEAVRQCSADSLFINFMNYLRTQEEVETLLLSIERHIAPGSLFWLGFGPAHHDVMECSPETSFKEILLRWQSSRVIHEAGKIVDQSGNVIAESTATLGISPSSLVNRAGSSFN